MISFIRKHVSYANVAVTAALVFAMAGGAFAASGGAKHVNRKRNTVQRGKLGPRGPQGVQGPAGVAGTSVTSASLPAGNKACPAGGSAFTSASGTTYACNGEEGKAGSNGRNGINGASVTVSEVPAGDPARCHELGGSEFTVSGTATYACNGKIGHSVLSGEGPPASGAGSEGDFYIDTVAEEIYGPKASSGWGAGTELKGQKGEKGEPWTPNNALPSGASETGMWSFNTEIPAATKPITSFGAIVKVPISFTIPLAAELDSAHVLKAGDAEFAKQCKGSVANPTAGKGYLCIYTDAIENAAWQCPAVETAYAGYKCPYMEVPVSGSQGTGKSGGYLIFESSGTPNHGTGSWALTAE